VHGVDADACSANAALLSKKCETCTNDLMMQECACVNEVFTYYAGGSEHFTYTYYTLIKVVGGLDALI